MKSRKWLEKARMILNQPGRPRISGIYTMFYYQDYLAAARWYEEIVGFERVTGFEGLALFKIADHTFLALVGAGYGSQAPIAGTGKGAILSIETDDLVTWHKRLFEHGACGTGQGLQIGADGRALEFKIQDPEGYTIEFFEWIE